MKGAASAVRRRLKQEAEARLRLDQDAAAERAYRNYLYVRDRVRLMGRMAGQPRDLTGAEQRMVTELAHLWDASPDTIARLRETSQVITGVAASDYVSPSADLIARLKREVGRVRRLAGDECFVEESALLGGFGYVRNSSRFNEDTARYFNALLALEDGGVLQRHRHATAPSAVWEVGGGWGGFAYQFKALCPRVTYLISGVPETFLVSAVYLMTVFPTARCRFYGETSPDDFWRNWAELDFLFAPEAVLATLRPPRFDLMLDIMSFRRMTDERVRAHVRYAFASGCPFVYSLTGAGERDVSESVRRAIEPFYWPHEVPGRLESAATDGRPNVEVGYDHLVGWKRLRV